MFPRGGHGEKCFSVKKKRERERESCILFGEVQLV